MPDPQTKLEIARPMDQAPIIFFPGYGKPSKKSVLQAGIELMTCGIFSVLEQAPNQLHYRTHSLVINFLVTLVAVLQSVASCPRFQRYVVDVV